MAPNPGREGSGHPHSWGRTDPRRQLAATHLDLGPSQRSRTGSETVSGPPPRSSLGPHVGLQCHALKVRQCHRVRQRNRVIRPILNCCPPRVGWVGQPVEPRERSAVGTGHRERGRPSAPSAPQVRRPASGGSYGPATTCRRSSGGGCPASGTSRHIRGPRRPPDSDQPGRGVRPGGRALGLDAERRHVNVHGQVQPFDHGP
jgi:hypothetical protein